MKQYIDKANILIEALPYIKEFNGKTVVIKYGGSAMVDEQIKEKVIEDIVLMKLVGIQPVIVHGGGKEISTTLEKMGITSNFYNGLRVTPKETVDVVEMVLSGKVNKDIVQLIQNHELNAVGISGKDGKTLKVRKKEIEGKDIGYVGEVKEVHTELIRSLIEHDFIPVIAPIGTDDKGETYNINADYAASSIAGALKAEKLIFLTDIEGVMEDTKKKTSLFTTLEIKEIHRLIKKGVIQGGMIPKVMNCIEGINKGVHSVHILDGRLEHSMLLEIFTVNGVGTKIYKEEG